MQAGVFHFSDTMGHTQVPELIKVTN